MCRILTQMKEAESDARRWCNADEDDHLQILYGQWALEAVRMQHIHADLCQVCMDQESKVRA